MQSADYKAMNDTQKAEYLDRVYGYAAAAAKANHGGKALEGWQANAKNAKADLGVSEAEYIALYEKYGSEIMSGKAYEKTVEAVKSGISVDEYARMKQGLDANGNGSVTQAEAKAQLDSMGFTNAQKVDLWTIINSSWKTNPYR